MENCGSNPAKLGRVHPVRKAVKMIDMIFELIPELGEALKDGELTPEEVVSIQAKLDKISDLIYKIKHMFK